jgi:hypothetical protein
MYCGARSLFRKRRVIFLTGAMCLVSFPACAELWCTGYYPGWEQGSVPDSQIDFPALTHIIHFSLLPKADVITMGMILHDWNLEKKMHLIRSAYDALPSGGALVAIEALIDDAAARTSRDC